MKFAGELIKVHTDSHEIEQMHYRNPRVGIKNYEGNYLLSPAPLDFLGRPDVDLKKEFAERELELQIAAYKLLSKRE